MLLCAPVHVCPTLNATPLACLQSDVTRHDMEGAFAQQDMASEDSASDAAAPPAHLQFDMAHELMRLQNMDAAFDAAFALQFALREHELAAVEGTPPRAPVANSSVVRGAGVGVDSVLARPEASSPSSLRARELFLEPQDVVIAAEVVPAAIAETEAHRRLELASTPTAQEILKTCYSRGSSDGNSGSPAPSDPVTSDPGGVEARVNPQLGGGEPPREGAYTSRGEMLLDDVVAAAIAETDPGAVAAEVVAAAIAETEAEMFVDDVVAAAIAETEAEMLVDDVVTAAIAEVTAGAVAAEVMAAAIAQVEAEVFVDDMMAEAAEEAAAAQAVEEVEAVVKWAVDAVETAEAAAADQEAQAAAAAVVAAAVAAAAVTATTAAAMEAAAQASVEAEEAELRLVALRAKRASSGNVAARARQSAVDAAAAASVARAAAAVAKSPPARPSPPPILSGAAQLLFMVAENDRALISLELPSNQEFILWTPGRQAAALRLLSSNTHVQKVLLTNLSLTDKTAGVLAEVLRANTTIVSLNIEGNDLRETALCEIARALTGNSTLRELKVLEMSKARTPPTQSMLHY